MDKKPPITQEQFDQVCKILSSTALSVHKASKSIGISTQSVYEFMSIVGQTAKDQYARAKDDQCDNIADDMQEIADNADDPNKGRLQVDTRKWYLSKIKPKRYGEHQQIEIVSSVKEFVVTAIKLIEQYVPEHQRGEVRAKLQASIDIGE